MVQVGKFLGRGLSLSKTDKQETDNLNNLYLFYLFIFIYLAVPGFNYSTQDL